MVGVPYINTDAIELLLNCCTSKEYDLWQSMGPNWTQPVKVMVCYVKFPEVNPEFCFLQHLRMSSSYQPIFTDGWAPVITELDLVGLSPSNGVTAPDSETESEVDQLPPMRMAPPGGPLPSSNGKRDYGRGGAPGPAAPRPPYNDDSDEYEDNNFDNNRLLHRGNGERLLVSDSLTLLLPYRISCWQWASSFLLRPSSQRIALH